MFDQILTLVNSGLGIFSEERRRYFEKGVYDRINAVKEAKKKRYPLYMDSEVSEAQAELDTYIESYAKELEANIKVMKEGVPHV